MTERSPRPNELNWVTPFLTVKDVSKSLEFYTTVFEFKEHQVVKNKLDEVIFARINYKQCNIVLMSHAPFELEMHRNVAPVVDGVIPSVSIYIYCDNLEDRYEKAMASNLEILLPPAKRFWGDKTFRVIDLNGYIWDFATNIDDFDPALLPPELQN